MEERSENGIENDDDPPRLSEETMKVLLAFYAEQEEQELAQKEKLKENLYSDSLEEEWNFSQFWYTDETAEALAKECERLVKPEEEIVCISCPTIYRHLKKLNIDIPSKILEYDRRFEIYGSDFVHYDYKKPMQVPESLKGTFSVVVADPPYLNDDCLTKTAITVKYLAKSDAKIILCTGAIMEEMAAKLLNVERCKFPIVHSKNLSNPFACYANYDLDSTCKPL